MAAPQADPQKQLMQGHRIASVAAARVMAVGGLGGEGTHGRSYGESRPGPCCRPRGSPAGGPGGSRSSSSPQQTACTLRVCHACCVCSAESQATAVPPRGPCIDHQGAPAVMCTRAVDVDPLQEAPIHGVKCCASNTATAAYLDAGGGGGAGTRHGRAQGRSGGQWAGPGPEERASLTTPAAHSHPTEPPPPAPRTCQRHPPQRTQLSPAASPGHSGSACIPSSHRAPGTKPRRQAVRRGSCTRPAVALKRHACMRGLRQRPHGPRHRALPQLSATGAGGPPRFDTVLQPPARPAQAVRCDQTRQEGVVKGRRRT